MLGQGSAYRRPRDGPYRRPYGYAGIKPEALPEGQATDDPAEDGPRESPYPCAPPPLDSMCLLLPLPEGQRPYWAGSYRWYVPDKTETALASISGSRPLIA